MCRMTHRMTNMTNAVNAAPQRTMNARCAGGRCATNALKNATTKDSACVGVVSMTILKLDFDGRIPRDFARRLQFVMRAHRLPVALERIDKTAHGFHVLLYVPRRVAFARVVLLQSLLGSDWKRETFNSRRANAWRYVPAFWRSRGNVLYTRHYRRVTP